MTTIAFFRAGVPGFGEGGYPRWLKAW